jgi:hypothetical protein
MVYLLYLFYDIEIIIIIVNFISDEHEDCLLSLAKNKDYNEYNIQVILAAHLFGPLAGGFEIGNKAFPKDARKCPKCGKDISEKLQNTSLGNLPFIFLF